MKKKILVLCGGTSKERAISIETGKEVVKELKKNKYIVIASEPNDKLLKNQFHLTKVLVTLVSLVNTVIFSLIKIMRVLMI